MTENSTPELELKVVNQVSFAVKDIDETIEAWSSMYGIGPWTFTENGGTDAKGRPWRIRMAFAYLGPVQIGWCSARRAGSSSRGSSTPGERGCTTSASTSMIWRPRSRGWWRRAPSC